jgi:hypothetical protein
MKIDVPMSRPWKRVGDMDCKVSKTWSKWNFGSHLCVNSMKKLIRSAFQVIVAFSVVMCACHSAWAQRPMPSGEQPPPSGASGATTPQVTAEKPANPKPKKVLAVVGGDIITVTKERIRKGTILIEDGKIVQVGQNVEVPEGAEKIDATGKVITPGFVAISMSGSGCFI